MSTPILGTRNVISFAELPPLVRGYPLKAPSLRFTRGGLDDRYMLEPEKNLDHFPLASTAMFGVLSLQTLGPWLLAGERHACYSARSPQSSVPSFVLANLTSLLFMHSHYPL